jgi:hypothetical protein
MTPASIRRTATLAAAVVGLLGLLAAPAAAHGRGSASTNFDSRILSAPDLEGITWEVLGGDQYLAVTNTSDTEITVTGYSDEPYLRVGPDGVFHNLASEATYVNADRYGEVTSIPADVGPQHEPRWEKVSDDQTYAWHDHRIHWMSPQLPPMVTDTSKATLVNPWEVAFTADGGDHLLTGELHWVPPPSPLPWIAGALALTSVALLGVRRRNDDNWVVPLVRPAALVLLTVSVLNITHLIDDFAAVPMPVASVLMSAVQTALFIALGVFGALVSMRGRDGAFTALGVGSGGIFIGQGLLYLDVLSTANSASVFPDWLARLVISLSLAQALWVVAVAVMGNRRLAALEPDDAASTPSEVGVTEP